jgi:hypothetical protein
VLFDLESGVIGAVALGEHFSPGNLVNQNRGKNWDKGH